MKLKVLETKKFKKLLSHLLRRNKISQEEYEKTTKIFIENKFENYKIRPHKIKCSNDDLISLSIINTQYRILSVIVCNPEIAVFVWIGTHKDYEIIIKNSKNCKNYLFECEELKELRIK